MTKVAIIGAGIGGLAAANLLAKRGYDVTIYEQQPAPGGRAGTLSIGGFTFDTGPSWYLMPEVFEQYFSLLDEDLTRYIDLQRLDPAYQVLFEGDRQPVTITADLTRDTATFESIEPGAGKKLAQYLVASEKMYQSALRYFLYTNFTSVRSFLSLDVIRSLPLMGRRAFEPIDRYVSRYFHDRRLRQIMEYPMVFLGTSPFQAPSLYSLMSYMDFSQGVYYPARGLYSIITALVSIGTKHGVKIHYDSPVASIRVAEDVASGIELQDGTVIGADIVISNADLHFSETALLEPQYQTYPEAYWQSRQPGPSAILMYLGVKGKLPSLRHHNLLFTKDWQANFSAIFDRQEWPSPASIYICNPSKTDPAVAPAGHENLFVLVPGPARTDDDPDTIEALADSYLQQIEAMTGIHDLRNRIVVKQLVSPHDFAHNFNSWNGTALGMSHILRQSAMFRPANVSKKVRGLYYVGGNTVPGIGLPMCLISAQLVTERIEQAQAKGKV